MRGTSSLAVCALALGCASPRSEVTTPGARSGPLGESIVEVDNGVVWPYSLSELLVGVDGIPDWSQKVRGGAGVRGQVALERGRYDVHLLARLSVSGASTEPCEVSIAVAQPIAVDTLPAEIRWQLYLRDATVPFVDRPELALRLEGARLDRRPGRPSWFDDRRCLGFNAVERASCRAAQALAEARARRDVVRALCSDDRRKRIDSLAAQIRDLRRIGARSRDGQEPEAAERQRLRVLLRQLDELSISLDECVGEDASFTEVSSRRWGSPGCSMDLPFEPAPDR